METNTNTSLTKCQALGRLDVLIEEQEQIKHRLKHARPTSNETLVAARVRFNREADAAILALKQARELMRAIGEVDTPAVLPY